MRVVPGLRPKTLLFLIAWVLLSAAGPLLVSADVIRTDWLAPAVLHRVVFTVQVLGVVFLFPLLLSTGDVLAGWSLNGPRRTDRGEKEVPGQPTDAVRAVRFFLFVIATVLSGVPFVYIAGMIADVSYVTLGLGQFQVVSLMAGIGGIWWGAGGRNTDWVHHVFLMLLVLSLLLPALYVGLLQVLDRGLPWLLLLSPVTAAAGSETVQGVNPRVFQAVLCLVSGILAGGLLYYNREPGSAE